MDGQLHSGDGGDTVRYERRLAHPPEQVWRALTDPVLLADWFPAAPDWELTPGAPITFVLVNVEAPASAGTVLAAEAPRLLDYSWGTEGFRWELAPDGGGTQLAFTVTFDPAGGSPEEAAGWHVCVEALDEALAGRPVPYADQLRRLEELLPSYAAKFA